MRIYFLAVLAFFLYVRCANIVPPTGGPRDLKAPVPTNTYPKNGTINYKQNFILVTFDEYIQDNQLSTKVIVSPIIEGKYKVKINKNVLKLTWQDTLKPNTTYTFNIAEGIKDITESNVIESHAVTFSTGPTIDSNMVKGKIKPLPGEKLSTHTKLLIFPVNDSILSHLRQKPEYVAAVDKDGNVEIPYIKEGKYTLIAVADDNKNNEWNKSEPIDIERNIEIVGTITKEFQLQHTTIDTAKLASTNNTEKNVKLFFTKGLQKISIKDSSGEYHVVKKLPREYLIHNQFKHTDTTLLQIQIVDSSGISSVITKKIKFKTIVNQKDRDTLINIEDINKTNKIKPHIDSLQFNLSKHTSDSIPVQITAPNYVTYRIINNYNNFTIQLKGQREKDSIFILIPKGTIHSVYGEYNNEYKKKYVTAEEKEYGNLIFSVKTEHKNYTIYLEDSKKNIVYTSHDKIHNHVKNLEPGDYKLFAVVDTDKNSVWNAYDPIKDLDAEPRFYFSETITIKANWDVEDIQMIF